MPPAPPEMADADALLAPPAPPEMPPMDAPFRLPQKWPMLMQNL